MDPNNNEEMKQANSSEQFPEEAHENTASADNQTVTQDTNPAQLQNEPVQTETMQPEPAQTGSMQQEPVQPMQIQTAPVQTPYEHAAPLPQTPYEHAAIEQQYPPIYSIPQQPQYPNTPMYGSHQQPPHYTQQPPAGNMQQSPAWNMYSPNIYANQPIPRERNTYNAPGSQTKKSKIGAFLRAACVIVLCTLFSAAAAYIVIDFRIDRGDFPQPANQVVLGNPPVILAPDDDPPAPLLVLPDGNISAQEIYDLALTQVVGISITAPDDSRFYGIEGSTPSVVGSGFIISADGYILTNYHVIEMPQALDVPIEVVLYDGSSYEAEIVGYEAISDVALLKINATGLNPTRLGNSGELRVGQTVYAVGNPFGDLVYTMTEGIVSALDRIVSVDGKTISTFQFSAAVNSGNSGGPIYNTSGEVIGIVTAKVTRGNVEGIGFAIPINDAVDIATALIEHGYISGRPLLGITINPVTEANAEYFGWVVGNYVRSVTPESAADKAGILVGDIITAINGENVDNTEALRFALRQFNAGDTTTITVWRDGEHIDLIITFDEDMNAGKPNQPVPTPDSPNPFENMP